jgi:hypothetical protein
MADPQLQHHRQRHVNGSSAAGPSKLSGGPAKTDWSPVAERPMEMAQLGQTSTEAPERLESLHVHANRLLKATEQCRLCRGPKRWQLAILANLGK